MSIGKQGCVCVFKSFRGCMFGSIFLCCVALLVILGLLSRKSTNVDPDLFWLHKNPYRLHPESHPRVSPRLRPRLTRHVQWMDCAGEHSTPIQ